MTPQGEIKDYPIGGGYRQVQGIVSGPGGHLVH